VSARIGVLGASLAAGLSVPVYALSPRPTPTPVPTPQVERAADRATPEAFASSLVRETVGGIVWEFPEAQRAAAKKWQKVATAWPLPKKARLTVRVYPDTVAKALYTGSSRPADLAEAEASPRVDIDAAAPAEPDLVSPVLASGCLAAGDPSLLQRPLLLAAAGIQRVGRFWGREVRTFATFERAASVEPTVEQVLASSEDLSPILAPGAAASWLDAGARLESEAAVEKALRLPEDKLAAILTRWRDAAVRQTLTPPKRRPLPPGFLRGVAYAMAESIEEGYVSSRSHETLGKLSSSGFDSISLEPVALVSGPKDAGLSYVRRDPRGETDEGLVRAAADAHAAHMTVLVKPRIVRSGGLFAGDLAMTSDGSWREWFAAYRRFVVHQAIVAEAAGVDLFCVGAELNATELRKNDWNEIIAAVRLATGAPLTYGARGTARAAEIPFWSSLDVVGVDFSDPLGKPEKLNDAQLNDGARKAVQPLAILALQAGRPILLTEAGYPAVRAAWVPPPEGDSRRPRAPEDAARAIAALYRALKGEPWWKGVYWSKAYSDGRAAPADERGVHFVGTPSEKAILDGFRALPAGAGTDTGSPP
jgi:hypothetical protein